MLYRRCSVGIKGNGLAVDCCRHYVKYGLFAAVCGNVLFCFEYDSTLGAEISVAFIIVIESEDIGVVFCVFSAGALAYCECVAVASAVLGEGNGIRVNRRMVIEYGAVAAMAFGAYPVDLNSVLAAVTHKLYVELVAVSFNVLGAVKVRYDLLAANGDRIAGSYSF